MSGEVATKQRACNTPRGCLADVFCTISSPTTCTSHYPTVLTNMLLTAVVKTVAKQASIYTHRHPIKLAITLTHTHTQPTQLHSIPDYKDHGTRIHTHARTHIHTLALLYAAPCPIYMYHVPTRIEVHYATHIIHSAETAVAYLPLVNEQCLWIILQKVLGQLRVLPDGQL